MGGAGDGEGYSSSLRIPEGMGEGSMRVACVAMNCFRGNKDGWIQGHE